MPSGPDARLRFGADRFPQAPARMPPHSESRASERQGVAVRDRSRRHGDDPKERFPRPCDAFGSRGPLRLRVCPESASPAFPFDADRCRCTLPTDGNLRRFMVPVSPSFANVRFRRPARLGRGRQPVPVVSVRAVGVRCLTPAGSSPPQRLKSPIWPAKRVRTCQAFGSKRVRIDRGQQSRTRA